MRQDLLLQWNDFKHFLNAFLCKNKVEKLLFFCLLLFYLPYSIYIAYTTSIIDHPVLEADLYFSFDNPLILNNGRTQLTAHPLLYLFYAPVMFLGNLLAIVLGMKAKTILFLVLTSSLISLSCIYIRRYLVEIVELENKLSLLLMLFFAFFATNLILAFTPESFTLATFFLAFNVYYYSWHIKKNTQPSLLSAITLGVFCLGGVTLTNSAKGILPTFFLKGKDKAKLFHRAMDMGVLFLLILIAIHIWFIYKYPGIDKNFFRTMVSHREYFSVPFISGWDYLVRVFSDFWGSPMLLAGTQEFSFSPTVFSGQEEHLIQTRIYSQPWQYLYAGVLLVSIIISIAANYKNRLVLLIVALFSIDIIIHCFMKFGMLWPFIYGGHWVYCVPLLLGWGLKKLNGSYIKGFTLLLAVLFAVLVANNLYQLYTFQELANTMFPPIP